MVAWRICMASGLFLANSYLTICQSWKRWCVERAIHKTISKDKGVFREDHLPRSRTRGLGQEGTDIKEIQTTKTACTHNTIDRQFRRTTDRYFNARQGKVDEQEKEKQTEQDEKVDERVNEADRTKERRRKRAWKASEQSRSSGVASFPEQKYTGMHPWRDQNASDAACINRRVSEQQG